MLNLYLISQNIRCDYDTYDSAVVCAESEDDARRMHPDGRGDAFVPEKGRRKVRYKTWCDRPDQVTVIGLGIAIGDVKRGVVCASFNAG